MQYSALIPVILMTASLGLQAQDLPMAPDSDFLLDMTSSDVEWLPADPTLGNELRIQGPDGTVTTRHFAPGEVPSWQVIPGAKGAMNGLYTYEIRSSLEVPVDRNDKSAGLSVLLPHASGYFTVDGGQILNPDLREQGLTKDIIHTDDVDITGGSLCVGFDCVDGENFGADTIRLKENNLRIHFDDTSVSGSFPANDWRIIANDQASGGASYLGIEDSTAGTIPFRVLAGAGNNALYVNGVGNVGLGTSTPSVKLQLSNGNTPTARLEQTNSGGFTAQTWDVAGNEANFFVRDVTNGSKLPFRIRPGAPTSSVDIAASGNVGVGTDSPAASLHVKRSNGSTQVMVEDTGSASPLQMFKLENNGFPAFNMTDTSQSNFSWTFRLSGQSGVDERFTITKLGTGSAEMELDANGNMAIRGSYSSGSSRTIKDDIVPVDGDTVLAKLDILPVAEWSYKADRDQRHVGPMAEDFYGIFGLGPDNKHVVATDMAGVALAAAKALKAENEQLKAQIAELRQAVRELQSGRSK